MIGCKTIIKIKLITRQLQHSMYVLLRVPKDRGCVWHRWRQSRLTDNYRCFNKLWR